jgi:hypothetical protein
VDKAQRKQVIQQARAMIARIDREMANDRRERRAWLMGRIAECNTGEPTPRVRAIFVK